MAIIKTATNKKTGEQVGWDDQLKQWVPITPGQATPGIPPTSGSREVVEKSVSGPDYPGPPSLGQKALGWGLKGLEMAALPFAPLDWATKTAIEEPLKKIPALAKPREIPLEALTPEVMPTEVSGKKAELGPVAEEVGLGANLLLTGPYAKALGKGASLLRQDLGLHRVLPPRSAGIPAANSFIADPQTDLQASADALLKQLGMGQAEAAGPAAIKPSPFAPINPELGPLFGGARENVIPFKRAEAPIASRPSPGESAQGSLLPPAMMSPPMYGTGRGPLPAEAVPPTGPSPFGGNIPRERWGTEAARMKKEWMRQVEHIKTMLSAR